MSTTPAPFAAPSSLPCQRSSCLKPTRQRARPRRSQSCLVRDRLGPLVPLLKLKRRCLGLSEKPRSFLPSAVAYLPPMTLGKRLKKVSEAASACCQRPDKRFAGPADRCFVEFGRPKYAVAIQTEVSLRVAASSRHMDVPPRMLTTSARGGTKVLQRTNGGQYGRRQAVLGVAWPDLHCEARPIALDVFPGVPDWA